MRILYIGNLAIPNMYDAWIGPFADLGNEVRCVWEEEGTPSAVCCEVSSVHGTRWMRAIAACMGTVRRPEVLARALASSRALDRPSIRGVRLTLSALGCLEKLSRIVRAYAPDVVHSHYLFRPACLGAAVCSGVWKVVSIQGSDIYFNPHLSPVHRLLELVALEGFDVIHVPTPAEAEAVAAVQPGLRRKTVVFPWLVDTELFHPQRGPHPSRPVTILSARKMEPTYGIDVIMTAVRTVLRATCHPVRFVFAGGGSMQDWLVQAVRSEGLDTQVKVLGWLGIGELARVMAESDVYVQAPESDALSYTLLQAMATGLACVSTDVGGNRYAVTDQVTGLLVPAADPRSLADALLECVESRRTRGALGEKAREAAVASFSRQTRLRELGQKLYTRF